MSDPSCAVVVPSFNRPRQLNDCLEALTRLEGPAPEIVVVDDGSPSPLAPVCAEFGNRVRCLRQPNRGPAAARNMGVRATSASFIAFTDDDCRPDPGWLAALRRAHDGRAERLVGGRVDNALPANAYSAASQCICEYLYHFYGAGAGSLPFFTSNNMGCDRQRFEELGGFDESFPFAAAEDRDFGFRWRAAGGALVYAPEAVVGHVHELDLRSFCRQHATYGRGARHLHRVLAMRGELRTKLERPAFYLGLMLHPLRQPGGSRLTQAALIVLSQVAMVGGYAAERKHERGACPEIDVQHCNGDVSLPMVEK